MAVIRNKDNSKDMIINTSLVMQDTSFNSIMYVKFFCRAYNGFLDIQVGGLASASCHYSNEYKLKKSQCYKVF